VLIFRVGEIVSGLSESLRRVLEVDGARTAAVLDVGTGMIVSVAGDEPDGLPEAAASLADEARLAGASLGPDDPAGDLEEMLVVTPARFQFLQVLSRAHGEGLLLFVDVDRARTNVALAAQQVARAAPAVLA
jgi:hypothetical protein